jgi:hypothetical protein
MDPSLMGLNIKVLMGLNIKVTKRSSNTVAIRNRNNIMAIVPSIKKKQKKNIIAIVEEVT